ncbi:hypothetical protein NBRC111894_1000 [Sporolactobacillus inulinus]|uniref:Uncharacterized protein n=1 Tax=Sporolactobacillus inulinus TaxID=2078 RepID=A0A4Y1Z8W9_9BACL|nr:hypothetical protein NBRC111894_1000 [Sporolactobacillus inulinus]
MKLINCIAPLYADIAMPSVFEALADLFFLNLILLYTVRAI